MAWLDESEEKTRARYERWKGSHELTGAHAIAYVDMLEAKIEQLSTDSIDPENIHFVMSHPEAVARQMTRDTERIEALQAEVERLNRHRDELDATKYRLLKEIRTLDDQVEQLREAFELLCLAGEEADYVYPFDDWGERRQEAVKAASRVREWLTQEKP